jgi:hypothetical protein
MSLFCVLYLSWSWHIHKGNGFSVLKDIITTAGSTHVFEFHTSDSLSHNISEAINNIEESTKRKVRHFSLRCMDVSDALK